MRNTIKHTVVTYNKDEQKITYEFLFKHKTHKDCPLVVDVSKWTDEKIRHKMLLEFLIILCSKETLSTPGYRKVHRKYPFGINDIISKEDALKLLSKLKY